jgi:DNA polymerase III delta prime subunit
MSAITHPQTKCDFQINRLCPRVKSIFSHYINHPSSIHHMLLYGPPGAGKTTTAEWFVHEIWKEYDLKQEVILILNAADERSLEAIRQKMYPFAEAQSPAVIQYKKPKFIILDECETLTETAQLALRPLLEYSPQEICLLFLCNSVTRVQHQLISRFLHIRFDPPTIKVGSTSMALAEWRNDFRKQTEKIETESFTSFIDTIINKSTPTGLTHIYDLSRFLRWVALAAYEFNLWNDDIIQQYLYLSHPDNNNLGTYKIKTASENLIKSLQCQFQQNLPAPSPT